MTDDELLARLAAALVPTAAPAEPTAAQLQDLHRTIDSGVPSAAPVPGRWPRLVPIGAAVAGAAVAVAMLVFATLTPQIDRETANRITVATTSPALADVHRQRRELESALADADVAAVVTEATDLRRAVNRLTAAEWAPLRPAIEDLLDRADDFVEGQRSPTEAPVTTGATTTTRAPTTTQPATRAVTVPAAPSPTGAAATSPAPPSPTTTAAGDDSSGPGGGGDSGSDGDDNSGPGGGGESGSGDSGGSGSGSGGDGNSGPGGGGD